VTSHPHVPSDDDATSPEQLIADCGCLRRECTCSGVSLNAPVHRVPRHRYEVHITAELRHLTDGISEYGD